MCGDNRTRCASCGDDRAADLGVFLRGNDHGGFSCRGHSASEVDGGVKAFHGEQKTRTAKLFVDCVRIVHMVAYVLAGTILICAAPDVGGCNAAHGIAKAIVLFEQS